MFEHNKQRNAMVEHWLDRNLSDNAMRDALGLFHYDGIDYPKTPERY